MAPKIFPRKPHTILRRGFLTSLNLEQLQEKISQAYPELPDYENTFLEIKSETSFALQTFKLYQQILFTLTNKKSQNLLLVDFREGDEHKVLPLLEKLQANLKPCRLPCARQLVGGKLVKGFHPDVAHYLVWRAQHFNYDDFVVLNSAIESAMGLQYSDYDRINQTLQSGSLLMLRHLGVCGGMPSPWDDENPKKWILCWDGKKVKLDATLESQRDEAGRQLKLHGWICPDSDRFIVAWVTEHQRRPRRSRRSKD